MATEIKMGDRVSAFYPDEKKIDGRWQGARVFGTVTEVVSSAKVMVEWDETNFFPEMQEVEDIGDLKKESNKTT